MRINGLPLPKQLVSLVASGQWKHPGDKILQSVVPALFIPNYDPVDFLTSFEQIERNSKLPIYDEKFLNGYKEGFGSQTNVPDLPWVDVEKRLFLAVCAVPGADVGIALDYRPSQLNPRVIACVYDDDNGFRWVLVRNSFREFALACGMVGD